LSDGRQTIGEAPFTAYGVAIDSDGRFAYVAGHVSGEIWKVSLENGSVEAKLAGFHAPYAIGFSADQRQLVVLQGARQFATAALNPFGSVRAFSWYPAFGKTEDVLPEGPNVGFAKDGAILLDHAGTDEGGKVLRWPELLGADPGPPTNDAMLEVRSEVTIRGRVVEGTPEVGSSSIDRDALGRYVRARKPALAACYERELKKNASMGGKLMLRFVIAPSGRATSVEITDGALGSDALYGCIKSIVRTWVFPLRPESDVPVAFPFVFSPAT
jgi:hypothetical protein